MVKMSKRWRVLLILILWNSQELSIWLGSTVKPPLALLAGDVSMVPRHFLVSGDGDQFLQLGRLIDDDLLHSLPLRTEKT